MSFRTLAGFVVAFAFTALTAAPAAAACCDKDKKGCCDDKAAACCDTKAASCCAGKTAAATAEDKTAGCCGEKPMPCCSGHDEQAAACCAHGSHAGHGVAPSAAAQPDRAPARQVMAVWFMQPVKIGDRILLGKYLVEHDNDRMARGEPCTHIYAENDRQLPAVAFHCTHLKRAASKQPSVTLRPLGEPNGMRELLDFQFANEDGAHGVPGR